MRIHELYEREEEPLEELEEESKLPNSEEAEDETSSEGETKLQSAVNALVDVPMKVTLDEVALVEESIDGANVEVKIELTS